MGRVVVLGASTTDMNMRLPRLPKPGQTLLGGFFTGPGGKGANQAVAARRAGAEVVFLTAFGDDVFAPAIRKHDEDEGIDLTYAKTVPGAGSGVAMIFIAEDGENLIGISMGANAHLSPGDIDALPDSVFDPDGVLLASLEVPIETVVRGRAGPHLRGMTAVANPAPGNGRLAELGALPKIDVLTPNESEAEVLTGRHGDDPAASADALRAEGVKAVVLSPWAARMPRRRKIRAHADPARKVEAVDTVGAGDAFQRPWPWRLSEDSRSATPPPGPSPPRRSPVTKPGAQGALPSREAIDELAARP